MRKPKWNIDFALSKHVNFQFRTNKLLWKDKFRTPRCEECPSIRISFLWFNIYARQENDEYWEQWLWINYYCKGDEEKAKATWPWTDCDKKESTWKEFK